VPQAKASMRVQISKWCSWNDAFNTHNHMHPQTPKSPRIYAHALTSPTYTQAHAHATHTHKLTPTFTHLHSPPHIHNNTHKHNTQTHTHTDAHAHPFTYTHMLTPMNTHPHVHSHTSCHISVTFSKIMLQCLSKAFTRPRSLWLFLALMSTCKPK